MPHNHEWQSRIKAVEREYVAMKQAADLFYQTAMGDPTILRQRLRPRDIIMASEHLEATYIIRLFAEFETGARQYWGTFRSTHPTTAGLLDGLAANCRTPDANRDNAHLVREYRNSLVHEREETPEAIPIAAARGHLCRFFHFLPWRW